MYGSLSDCYPLSAYFLCATFHQATSCHCLLLGYFLSVTASCLWLFFVCGYFL